MSRDNLNVPPGINLDADAVCAQCGTVNPEGTLICKVCGNNLRDQRTLRMQTESQLESMGEPPAGRNWFTGVLTAIGAIVVVVFALNVNSIANFVVAGGVETTGAGVLWESDQAQVFDSLRDQAKDTELSADVIGAAVDAAVPLEDGVEPPALDGVYVLLPANATEEAEPFGTAAVKLEGSEYIFAAVLSDGTEVRGWGTQRSAGLITAEAQRAAAKVERSYEPVYGYAQRESDGSFSGWGQFQASDLDLVPFIAYRLP
jgi:hypothetical protein